MTVSTRYADNGGVQLAWESLGPESPSDRPPLLLIMGHAYPRTMWRRNLAALTSRRRVVMFDNRGAGESDSPPGPYSVGQQAADAVAVMDAAGLDRADVYGVSMGGLIAQELAATSPSRVNRLVLGCTAATEPMGQPSRSAEWFYSLPRPLLAIALTRQMYGPARDAVHVREDLKTLRRAKMSARGCRAQTAAIMAAHSHPEQITAPTLVIHGDADTIIPIARARSLAARLPDSELVILKGAGHNYNSDLTDQADDAITAFLDR